MKLVAAATDFAVVAARTAGEKEGFLFCHAMVSSLLLVDDEHENLTILKS